jgi:glycosyltransferase involved in cell wall biosynthesis
VSTPTLQLAAPDATQPGAPLLSLVVPTRNESEGLEALLERTSQALRRAPWAWELLLVDDSDDATPQRAAEAADRGHPVRVLHRPTGERVDGLSGAVIAGFAAARGSVLAVMDADLQHPPEVLPRLVDELVEGGADIAIASRYCAGTTTTDSAGLDGRWRRLASRVLRWPAWAVRPRLLRVADPLAGFFALRREVLLHVRLRPTGYKILLEVLARGRWSRVVEVPYSFAPRTTGTSKAELRQGANFLRHIARLATDRTPG